MAYNFSQFKITLGTRGTWGNILNTFIDTVQALDNELEVVRGTYGTLNNGLAILFATRGYVNDAIQAATGINIIKVNQGSLANYGRVGLQLSTTGATFTRMSTDGQPLSNNNQYFITDSLASRAIIRVVGYDTVTADSKAMNVTILIKRTPAGVVSLVGTPSVGTDYSDTATSTWTFTVAADNTTKSLNVSVRGAGTNIIKWSCVIETLEAGL